jgi:predicted nucleotidyltransferase
MEKPRLSSGDQAWLHSYRAAMAARFGQLVRSIIVFGSKARGDATADSDLDLLLVIEEGDWRVKSELADVAYELAVGTDVVPSVKIYTRAEWERLRESGSPFREAITREGLLVA